MAAPPRWPACAMCECPPSVPDTSWYSQSAPSRAAGMGRMPAKKEAECTRRADQECLGWLLRVAAEQHQWNNRQDIVHRNNLYTGTASAGSEEFSQGVAVRMGLF